MLVVPSFQPAEYADRGAVGLLVPGSGATVTRAGALASLLRGRTRNALLGGTPGGRPLISLARSPGAVNIYVALPPPGSHQNVRRYPIAIVGGGYRGILVSRSTRIRGLVSIADVAPTALALGEGRRPTIQSRPEADAAGDLSSLDRRLADAHDARDWATLALVGAALLLSALGFLGHSPSLGRAAVLAMPAALATALGLSLAHETRPGTVPLLLLLTAGAALAASRLPLTLAAGAFFLGYLVVLAAWPMANALAMIGPHPDGGGRFYGITNQVETLLVAPALAAAAARPRWLLPVALLALVTLGWSRAGADGGGVVVLAVGFLVLALRLRGLALTPRRLVLVAAGAAALGLALVGLDAALGGSSHVTRAVGSGPGSLLGDLGHRLHVSYAGVTSSWHATLAFVLTLAALAWFATRRRRFASTDALLAALAVSLLVNDTPTDVAGFGALSCAALWTWERVR